MRFGDKGNIMPTNEQINDEKTAEIICPLGIRKRVVYESKDSKRIKQSYVVKGHFAYGVLKFIDGVKNGVNSLKCFLMCGSKISNFDRIVYAAEKYFVDNAEDILYQQRGWRREDKLCQDDYSRRCKKLLEDENYHPIWLRNEENNKNNELPYDGNKIFYISDVLSLDFLKELFGEFIYKPGKVVSEDKLKKDFIRFSRRFNNQSSHNWYKPFYIDKLLWLCSCGNFYPDGVIIKEMTRENFLKVLRGDIKKGM